MLRIATSTWTLHDTLGRVWYEHDGKGGAAVNKAEPQDKAMPLLDVPAFVAKDGIHVLEICHFQIPSTDDVYLAELKSALEENKVELVNLLVDTGDLSNPDLEQQRADIAMTKGWQEVAVQLGAKGSRIDCGLQEPTSEAMQRSAMALRELADHGTSLGLSTVTENWRTISKEPENLLNILQQVERPLKLCVDFGNAAKTKDKYKTLAALLPHSISLHCKGIFADGVLDLDEFYHCLSLVKEADFDGHIALIYDGYDDEWDKVLALKEKVEAFYPEIGQAV